MDGTTADWPKLKIGISSCLLGNRVRHNGEHKFNTWLVEQLGPVVSWLPICPEVEMGLGVPRQTVRLTGSADHPRMVTFKSQEDITDQAHATVEKILAREMKLDAFIFKKDSPTCGLERVKVYGKSGIPTKDGVGIFAKAIRQKFPLIPMIEEGRLTDLSQREAFLIQLYLYGRFNRLAHPTAGRRTIRALQAFHQHHKLQLMAFDPTQYSKLGQIAADSRDAEMGEVYSQYEAILVPLIQKKLSARKYANVLQHVLGYFKKLLTSEERAHLLELINGYRNSRLPLVSVTTLFRFLIQKYSVAYLANQSLFQPYPPQILLGDVRAEDSERV